MASNLKKNSGAFGVSGILIEFKKFFEVFMNFAGVYRAFWEFQ
jgi:hypothetical protein